MGASMTDSGGEPASGALELLDQLCAVRSAIAGEAHALLAQIGGSSDDPSLANLAHYLLLRRRDLRPLQRQLMLRGLSSLGRLEGRVLPGLDATIAALSAVVGRDPSFPAPTEDQFFAGENRLAAASTRLLGDPFGDRRTAIMVTLPSEAADDPELVAEYARAGMDIARINCAHDDKDAWRRMSSNVRSAALSVGRPLRVLMDIAGPKIRTGTVGPCKERLLDGDTLLLFADAAALERGDARFVATISLPAILARLAVGDRVLYNDGKLEGIVETVAPGEVRVRVTLTRAGGVKLRAEKGLNFPDTSLGLSPLTSKDEADIATLIECADLLGYSFVSEADDISLLERLLAEHGGRPSLGLVAKIERPEAIQNLPALIARATRDRPFGIMIARGDLAVEIGFERLAEMQEELLWLSEAAAVPVIWATQVLEGLIVQGVPTRGEMTDAAMSARAECVMLNKGPNLVAAIEVLDRLLGRMDDNLDKKTPLLRALKSW